MMETEIQGTGNNKIKSILKEILSISIYLLLVFCAAYLIVTYVGQRTQVSGSSMETTLSDGDHLIVDRYLTGLMIRSGLTLLYFLFNMIWTHIISNELSECRVRQCRLTSPGTFI